MIKVVKFGGSSLADAKQFQKVKQIVQNDDARRFVIVSATGRIHKKDNKITDLLYLCHAHLKYHVNCDAIFQMIEERFLSIQKELNLKYPITKDLNQLKEAMNKSIPLDYLVSRGEYLTAKLMAEYLGYTFLDAKDLIYFSYDGKIDFMKTKAMMEHALQENDRFVIPGFYGAMRMVK